jgi:hypothetical protein
MTRIKLVMPEHPGYIPFIFHEWSWWISLAVNLAAIIANMLAAYTCATNTALFISCSVIAYLALGLFRLFRVALESTFEHMLLLRAWRVMRKSYEQLNRDMNRGLNDE